MKTYLFKLPSRDAPSDFVAVLAALHENLVGQTWSFEIARCGHNLGLYFTAHKITATAICSELYAAYPQSEIIEVQDFLPAQAGLNLATSEMHLVRTDLYSLKGFSEFENSSLKAWLQVASQSSDSLWLQVVCQPLRDSAWLHLWRRVRTFLESIRQMGRMKYWFKTGVKAQFAPHIHKKSQQRLWRVSVRLGVASANAQSTLDTLEKALMLLNTTDFNQLNWKNTSSRKLALKKTKQRQLGHSFTISDDELGALWHVPSQAQTHLVKVLAARHAAPPDLPDQPGVEVSLFGQTNFHQSKRFIGLRREDRQRHLYCVGKSGSGKSKLLELLIQSDLQHGAGLAVLDPHGDLVDNILRLVPEHRAKDVVVFDPSDIDFPLSFNPLANVDPKLKMRVTIGFIEVFKKLFGVNWSPRLEHVLRYTVLALLDTPGANLVSIQQMLTDKNYRQYVVKNIQDDVVKNFWTQEFAAWSQKFDAEAITPLLNKVGQFVATNQIRNLVGQRENALDFRRFMDEGKIVLMKISKGMLGEDNAQLLGAMLVTKIYQAAMSRADIPESERRDFNFYVDEFQHFATDTFGEILSEARKYRLNLTLAHQFLGQLPNALQQTVFGNVGSLITFRLGGEDALVLEKELLPQFKASDITNLGVREFYAKLSIQGKTQSAFSGQTLDLAFPKKNFSDLIISHSRQKYAQPLSVVERRFKFSTEAKAPDFPEPLI